MKTQLVFSQEELENVLFNSFAQNLNNSYLIQPPYIPGEPNDCDDQCNPMFGNQWGNKRQKTTFEHSIGADGKLTITMSCEPLEA